LQSCPNCGSQFAAALPSGYGPATPEIRHRSQKKLAIAIVLIVLAVSGVAGYFVYDNIIKTNQAAIQAVAAANEKAAASSAIDSMTITCASNTYDYSGMPYSASFTSTFGVNNPSKYPMDTTWTFNLNYPNSGVTLNSAETFHVAAHAIAYPKWKFTLTSSQITAINNDSTKAFKMSIDRTYTVQGSYGNYPLTRHDTYDTATGASTGSGGSLGGGISLQPCPA
jgi:uncharacterized protein (UPF0333 family)